MDFHMLSKDLVNAHFWISGTNLGVPASQYYWNTNGVDTVKGYVNWVAGFPLASPNFCVYFKSGRWECKDCFMLVDHVLCQDVLWMSIKNILKHVNQERVYIWPFWNVKVVKQCFYWNKKKNGCYHNFSNNLHKIPHFEGNKINGLTRKMFQPM